LILAAKGSEERKVRTPKGSEPANGGAFEGHQLQVSNPGFKIAFELSSIDDKCNREKTSRPLLARISDLRPEAG
jgi:hypothetical protein